MEEKSDVQWDDVKEMAEHVIVNLPRLVNQHRRIDQHYEAPEAKVKLKELKLLSSDYELSEECISSSTVFSDHGRTELINALTRKLDQVDQNETAVAIYTCRPYIFPVGKHKDALFLVDTHPVSEEVGGNCNGLLLVTPDCSPRSCKLLVQWILKRLLKSGTSEKELQSMAWLTPIAGVKIFFSNSFIAVWYFKLFQIIIVILLVNDVCTLDRGQSIFDLLARRSASEERRRVSILRAASSAGVGRVTRS